MRYFIAKYPHARADDLVQEVLLRLVRRQREGAIDASRGDLIMFAFGIARNIVLESKKSARGIPPHLELDHTLDIPCDSPSAETLLKEAQQRKILRDAIATLSVDEQQVVMLYMDHESSLVEIAACLNMPIGTVKSHLHRAKARLKEQLIPQRGEIQ
jgi:RNA polymerase sigma-70 factor (ECF subfamily)